MIFNKFAMCSMLFWQLNAAYTVSKDNITLLGDAAYCDIAKSKTKSLET